MSTAFTINTILCCLGTVIYLSGAVVIFKQSYSGRVYPRARRALALLLLMWGVFAVLPILDDPQGRAIDSSLMSVTTLLIGGFSMIITLLYPLELSRPGWITTRRVITLSLPILLLSGFYFFVLMLLGQPIYNLNSIEELTSSLGEFNVWFRFVLYFAVCFYLAYLFLCTNISALQLHKRSIGDTTPICPQQASWLRIYAIGQVCIAIAYFGLLLHGDIWAQIIHRTVAILFFSTVIYMVGYSPSQNPKQVN